VHALVLVNKQTQQNARELRPLMDALAQVPHKTPLGTKETLTLASVLVRVHNNSADPQGNTNALCC